MNYQYCNAKTEKSNEGMLKTNGPPFQDGTGKAAFSPFCRAHVLEVRSARQHKGVPLRDKLSNFALRDAASNTAALLDNFLIIPVGLLIVNSSVAYTGFLREIFNRLNNEVSYILRFFNESLPYVWLAI
jgi:hypothetical protein